MPRPLMLIAITSLTLASLGLSASALACDHHLERADHYHKLRRAGGTPRQMANWQAQRRKYQKRYQDCRLGDRSGGSIRTASGSREPAEKPDYQKPRTTEVGDARVRKLLETCNYWVRTYNDRPTDQHRSYRDGACRAFSEAERRLHRPPARLSQHTRTLDECIKPGNQLDNEVQECLEGRREPAWNATR